MWPDDVCLILRHCLNHISDTANFRAWDLLRQILDDKPWIRNNFSCDIVSWVTDESRQGIFADSKMEIDEVEKEVLAFKDRMELEEGKDINGEPELVPISGWRKWKGEWTPRPIGVRLESSL